MTAIWKVTEIIGDAMEAMGTRMICQNKAHDFLSSIWAFYHIQEALRPYSENKNYKEVLGPERALEWERSGGNIPSYPKCEDVKPIKSSNSWNTVPRAFLCCYYALNDWIDSVRTGTSTGPFRGDKMWNSWR